MASKKKSAPAKAPKKKIAARKPAAPAKRAKAKAKAPMSKAVKKPVAKTVVAKAPAAKAKPAPAPVRKLTAAEVKKNGRIAREAAEHPTKEILRNNHVKERRLDPFTRGQRDKLLQLRDAMVDSMAGVAQDTLRSRAEGSEASAFGMHQADAGSDAYDRDFALSLLSQEQDALYEIDQALKRIELGSYGVCEMSGKPIMHARLEAIPFARYTVECQSQLEKQNKASRVRQSVTSLFGLTDEEGGEAEEEEAKTDDSKE